jgi:hypothetical protein
VHSWGGHADICCDGVERQPEVLHNTTITIVLLLLANMLVSCLTTSHINTTTNIVAINRVADPGHSDASIQTVRRKNVNFFYTLKDIQYLYEQF